MTDYKPKEAHFDELDSEDDDEEVNDAMDESSPKILKFDSDNNSSSAREDSSGSEQTRLAYLKKPNDCQDSRVEELDDEHESIENVKCNILEFLKSTSPASKSKIESELPSINEEILIRALNDLVIIGKITKEESRDDNDEMYSIKEDGFIGKLITNVSGKQWAELQRGELVLLSKPNDGYDIETIFAEYDRCQRREMYQREMFNRQMYYQQMHQQHQAQQHQSHSQMNSEQHPPMGTNDNSIYQSNLAENDHTVPGTITN